MTRRRRGAAVFAAALLVATASATASAWPALLPNDRAATARHRGAAQVDAAARLVLLRLPAGAERLPTPAGRPPPLEAIQLRADRVGIWSAPGTIDGVFAFIEHHRPRGATEAGTSSADGPGITSESIIFTWPHVAQALGDRMLTVTISPRPAGRVRVRAQTETQFILARPRSERVPASIRTIAITVRRGDGRRLEATRTITEPHVVHRIATLFNAMEVIQPEFAGCPFGTGADGREVTFVFGGAGGVTLARAAYAESAPLQGASWFCSPTALTVGGRARDPLLGSPQLAGALRAAGLYGLR